MSDEGGGYGPPAKDDEGEYGPVADYRSERQLLFGGPPLTSGGSRYTGAILTKRSRSAAASLREKEVEAALRRYLKRKGYHVMKRKGPQGVDIKARDKSGRDLYVEVEGNKKPDGRPLTTSQKYTHLLRAVGQISLRMSGSRKNSTYALGLPLDPYYYKMISMGLSTALGRLRVVILWVGNKGKVTRTKPT